MGQACRVGITYSGLSLHGRTQLSLHVHSRERTFGLARTKHCRCMAELSLHGRTCRCMAGLSLNGRTQGHYYRKLKIRISEYPIIRYSDFDEISMLSEMEEKLKAIIRYSHFNLLPMLSNLLIALHTGCFALCNILCTMHCMQGVLQQYF